MLTGWRGNTLMATGHIAGIPAGEATTPPAVCRATLLGGARHAAPNPICTCGHRYVQHPRELLAYIAANVQYVNKHGLAPMAWGTPLGRATEETDDWTPSVAFLHVTAHPPIKGWARSDSPTTRRAHRLTVNAVFIHVDDYQAEELARSAGDLYPFPIHLIDDWADLRVPTSETT